MVFSRNPEREARLLDQWVKGITAREAAANAGVPEGTTFYYYRKFNRDPEKANRLARSLKPRKKLTTQDVLLQSMSARSAEIVSNEYLRLIGEGKFADAYNYVRAAREHRRLRGEMLSDVNSIIAVYMSDPDKNEALIPRVVREVVQIAANEGHSFEEAIEIAENSASPFLLVDATKRRAALFGLAFAALKREHAEDKEAKNLEKEKADAGRTELPRDQPSGSFLRPKSIEPPKKGSDWDQILEALDLEARKNTEVLAKMKARGEKFTASPVVFKTIPPPPAGTSASGQLRDSGKAKLGEIFGPRHQGPMPNDTAGPKEDYRSKNHRRKYLGESKDEGDPSTA